MYPSSVADNRSDHVDTTLAALADERRRLVLQYLRSTPDGVGSYDDVVTFVTAHSSRDDTPESVLSYLVHAGFPKLATAGIIEYDRRSETVRIDQCPVAERILDCL